MINFLLYLEIGKLHTIPVVDYMLERSRLASRFDSDPPWPRWRRVGTDMAAPDHEGTEKESVHEKTKQTWIELPRGTKTPVI